MRLTLTTCSRPARPAPDGRREVPRAVTRRGFTLIELMLVMAMLITVLSLGAPSLTRFFRGRSLDSEAHRFLALTRYGQSRAVSEGIPMVLWIDAQTGAYGLAAEETFTELDEKGIEFQLDPRLLMELPLPVRGIDSRAAGGQAAVAPTSKHSTVVGANLPRIYFRPNGSIGEASPAWVRFQERKDERGANAARLWVAQSRNRLGYEIRTNQPVLLRW